MAAVSKSDAWAVGSLIEHWNGHQWSVVPGPKTGECTVFLNGVAASSASAAWAVGYCGKNGSHRPIIERWNGRHWSVQPSPGTTASSVTQLNAVTASGSSAWAVGEYRSKGRTIPLIERWNGHGWKVQASPDPSPQGAELASVTALSADSAWAVGTVLSGSVEDTSRSSSTGTGTAGTSSPASARAARTSCSTSPRSPATQAWAAGAYTFGSNLGTLVETWDGASWQEQATPGPDLQDVLLGIAARSATNVWTVGTRTFLTHPRTLIQHWNGTRWTVVPSPNPSAAQDAAGLDVAMLSGSYAGQWAIRATQDPDRALERNELEGAAKPELGPPSLIGPSPPRQ